MKLFKKESVGFKRKITLFGFINIAYNSKSGYCLKIKDLGLNNNVKSNDSIVGSGSVVTGQFTQQNTVIAGNPARVVKENVYWKR